LTQEIAAFHLKPALGSLPETASDVCFRDSTAALAYNALRLHGMDGLFSRQ
jgi:hypothetical protein